ncbi:MAG: PRC-barrel domain containing protein [Rhodoferax sp.]|uniref:PRC-barrel domain-containing protein n=1 Tax=Rhodoferax sp. TaxID=50421 RepID=UPI001400BE17|nr:PRC-barrel domain-containing protein [Rhodoferax sp.]NDP38979.1 PRC-barrel domain containing protein [Rhodoferax sp.]
MLRSLKELEKCTIGATDGDIGQVKDLYFDDRAWVVRYLIVDTGSWLSGRKVLISPIAIEKPDWPAHRLAAMTTRDQVKNSPDIDTDKPVSRQHEVQYLGYYGYPTYWGGAGLWGAGMYPFATVPGQAELPLGVAARQRAIAGADAERERHRDDDPHLRSCEAVVGYHIHATDGEVGHVEGFLVDDETWAIRYIVVNTSNWWIGHKVLIAPQWIGGIQWSDESVTVDLSRDAVKAAPTYDPPTDLDRQRETSLYTHYGRPPYWTADSKREHDI